MSGLISDVTWEVQDPTSGGWIRLRQEEELRGDALRASWENEGGALRVRFKAGSSVNDARTGWMRMGITLPELSLRVQNLEDQADAGKQE